MRQLAVDHRRGDHAGHAPALRQHGVRGNPHQPDVGPAIHQLAPAARQRAAERGRRLGIGRVVAGARAAEDRDPSARRRVPSSPRLRAVVSPRAAGHTRIASWSDPCCASPPSPRSAPAWVSSPAAAAVRAKPARRSHRRRRQGLRREGRRAAARPEPPPVAGAVGVVELHHQRHRGDLGQHLPAVHRRDDEDGQGRGALRRVQVDADTKRRLELFKLASSPLPAPSESGQAGRADQARRRPRGRLRPRQVLPARQAVPTSTPSPRSWRPAAIPPSCSTMARLAPDRAADEAAL